MISTYPTSIADNAASENWARYLYGKDRGHTDYLIHAARCEDMYLGGGRQLTPEQRAALIMARRPGYEFNQIMPSVNSAIGYQLHNRMDIAFKPRGGDSDLFKATILSKVVMQVADQCALHWQETQMFSDGLIQQRGYYDVRMSFDENIKGEIVLSTLDPLDVIPDPDAKSYDPDKWGDVIITRWLTLDEIEQVYGKEARKRAELSNDAGHDFGDLEDGVERNKFATRKDWGYTDACVNKEDGLERYRIIDRQRFVYELTPCLVWPGTGDVQVEANMAADSVADALSNGAVRTKRMRRRVKWVVTTFTATLHDQYSPYESFTVVPYFAYFRRGKTAGMVDNAIGPQEVLNKAVSQVVHIVNSSANSGWVVEENSISNMTMKELEVRGAQNGLVIEFKKGTTPPRKIEPNQVPTGVTHLIDRADKALKDVTVPEAMRGVQGPETSGIAIQAKQFASQQQLSVPLDHLTYTRQLLAKRILKLIQRYYDTHRIFRITETDPMTGKPKEELLEINKFDPATGGYINDVTIGTYDVVITEQPMQVTFQNSQFQQALEMRKAGVRINDATMVRYSNLSDKQEILESLPGDQPPADPAVEARVRLLDAQTRKTDAQATDVKVKTQYSGVQTAQVVAQIPATAALADGLLKSAGYVDQDAAPIVPSAPGGLPTVDMPHNTDPMNPASPAVGASEGIETLAADGLQP
ncbi:genomic island protein [Acidovorax sp. K2F]|uniref:portal protein n=1 Tax=Acidovorax sp. K2F TaxID=2978125 RepID=UPI0021B0AB3A|nr:genomic island protein [Acidovorax sp. K2F]MCT6720617.1 genomic island protein [Acidovorax sp. K2F]